MKFEIYMYYVAMLYKKKITLHLMVYVLIFKFTDSVKKKLAINLK